MLSPCLVAQEGNGIQDPPSLAPIPQAMQCNGVQSRFSSPVIAPETWVQQHRTVMLHQPWGPYTPVSCYKPWPALDTSEAAVRKMWGNLSHFPSPQGLILLLIIIEQFKIQNMKFYFQYSLFGIIITLDILVIYLNIESPLLGGRFRNCTVTGLPHPHYFGPATERDKGMMVLR